MFSRYTSLQLYSYGFWLFWLMDWIVTALSPSSHWTFTATLSEQCVLLHLFYKWWYQFQEDRYWYKLYCWLEWPESKLKSDSFYSRICILSWVNSYQDLHAHSQGSGLRKQLPVGHESRVEVNGWVFASCGVVICFTTVWVGKGGVVSGNENNGRIMFHLYREMFNSNKSET